MTTFAPALRPMRVGAFGFLLALLLTLITAAPGLAHDSLTDSSPADGDSGPPPTELVLTFSGEIASVGAAVEATGPDGVVSEGAPEVEGFTVTQPLAADLPAGDYQVAWRVTSSDGHPISGEYTFTVEVPADDTESTEEANQTTAPPAGDDDATDPADTATADNETGDTETAAPDAADTTDQEDSGGMPVWTWAVIVVALLGLGAVVVRVVRNSR
ncbi:copper resistance CopC family protein [Ornithinicoccus hortensis]|uniref:CopC domain-containing protein n=1 Tax=Ornithinicoccus hortensis TaxID=82346 RepID=A0A542YNK5_9MICO|nr:copper resistance CopC family protein [Ornithinicoccus hortensis]TQL49692.1 hypothetical protein FB467_0779 [Ornithinicoccus hortensis]